MLMKFTSMGCRRIRMRPSKIYRLASHWRLTVFVGVLVISALLFHYLNIAGVIYTLKYLASKPDNTKILCPYFQGGLGNQMFQYATAYSIARIKNMSVLVGSNCELLKAFNLNAVVLPKVACWMLTTRTERRPCAFDKDTVNFTADHHYRMQGYFQSWWYFSHVESALRQIFKFKPSIQQEAATILHAAIEKHEKLVGSRALTFIAMHIRRGDILTDRYRTYGYNSASIDYVRRAMQHFGDRFHRILFVVCTNDLQWTRKYLTQPNVFIVENTTREVDMAIMASCNHTIITVGSYGWWSGWLANGDVVYYRYPAARGSILRKGYSKDMSDFFYPNWTPML
ncbi:galactoside 2-alpha-L-fucosyltransferase 2-like [Argonauta hians]